MVLCHNVIFVGVWLLFLSFCCFVSYIEWVALLSNKDIDLYAFIASRFGSTMKNKFVDFQGISTIMTSLKLQILSVKFGQ